MAGAGLVAACRNRPKLPGFGKEIPDPMPPPGHFARCGILSHALSVATAPCEIPPLTTGF
ncbi:MAG: hypothetical protein OXC72_09420 [Roseovarius sp.]|nr:hypothetical protein [Roseovarius sp.]